MNVHIINVRMTFCPRSEPAVRLGHHLAQNLVYLCQVVNDLHLVQTWCRMSFYLLCVQTAVCANRYLDTVYIIQETNKFTTVLAFTTTLCIRQ